MKAWREFPCDLWKVTSASSNRMRYHSHDAQIWCKGKAVMGWKGMSSLTVSALCCTQNAPSVCSSGLSAELFMSGFSFEVWMHVKLTRPSILSWDGDLDWQMLVRAGRLGWQNVCALLVTVMLRHMAGPASIAKTRCTKCCKGRYWGGIPLFHP